MLIGCLPRLALADAFSQGRLVELAAPELALMRKFYFVIHREKYRTAGINAFAQICQAADGTHPDIVSAD